MFIVNKIKSVYHNCVKYRILYTSIYYTLIFQVAKEECSRCNSVT